MPWRRSTGGDVQVAAQETDLRVLYDIIEDEIAPLIGAKVVARAWTDIEFKEYLLKNGIKAVVEFDVVVNDEVLELRVVENTPETHNLIVCTLCSCYPWAVLRPPPTWYKTPTYRSRTVDEPRTR